MNLDADRLAKLAGLPVSGKRSLNEAGNRSFHEDPAVSDEADYRFGKNQLAERGERAGDEGAGDKKGDTDYSGHGMRAGDKSDTHPGEEDDTTKKGEKKKTSGRGRGEKKGDEAYVNEIIEIDDRMIAAEIKRMRKQRLEENVLRSVIRKEIGTMLEDIKAQSFPRSKHWKPSKHSGVAMGMVGPGFR